MVLTSKPDIMAQTRPRPFPPVPPPPPPLSFSFLSVFFLAATHATTVPFLYTPAAHADCAAHVHASVRVCASGVAGHRCRNSFGPAASSVLRICQLGISDHSWADHERQGPPPCFPTQGHTKEHLLSYGALRQPLHRPHAGLQLSSLRHPHLGLGAPARNMLPRCTGSLGHWLHGSSQPSHSHCIGDQLGPSP